LGKKKDLSVYRSITYGGRASPQYFGHFIKKEVGRTVALRATILPTPLKFFVWFNKDHENTDYRNFELGK